jgi:hypothetical protein
MSATNDLIAALVKSGMDIVDAAGLVARAGAEMAAGPSKAALRTRKWREKQASQNVTSDGQVSAPKTVTNRHKPSQTVTGDVPPLSLKEDSNIENSKKRERRASQLPDGWKPDETAWQNSISLVGLQRCELELTKFKNYAADKGRVSKSWNAAWRNWIDRAIDYGATNGARNHHPQRRSASADFFAGMSSVAEDIAGHDPTPRPTDSEIPLGRVNIEH